MTQLNTSAQDALSTRLNELQIKARSEEQIIGAFNQKCETAETGVRSLAKAFLTQASEELGKNKKDAARIPGLCVLHMIADDCVKEISRRLKEEAQGLTLDALAPMRNDLIENSENLCKSFPSLRQVLSKSELSKEQLNLLDWSEVISLPEKCILVSEKGDMVSYEREVSRRWDCDKLTMSDDHGDWDITYAKGEEYRITRREVSIETKFIIEAMRQMLAEFIQEQPDKIGSLAALKDQIRASIDFSLDRVNRASELEEDRAKVEQALFGPSKRGVKEIIDFEALLKRAQG